MCDYSKMVENKGIIKGVVEGLLSALKKMIANANMTPEQAMNILDIPENQRAMNHTRQGVHRMLLRHLVSLGRVTANGEIYS